MNFPTSTPKIPQTPNGPGVGGTREWVITSPAASAVPSPITDFLVALEIAFAIGASTTNPESQKIGIDTRNPVSARASSSLFLPNSFKNVCAILLAAPVTSKIWPIITPNPIMIPILPKVPPNPEVIEFTIPNVFSTPSTSIVMFVSGMPPITPTTTVLMIRARNAWIFVFNTRNIRTAIPIARPINILSPLSPFTIIQTSYVLSFLLRQSSFPLPQFLFLRFVYFVLSVFDMFCYLFCCQHFHSFS